MAEIKDELVEELLLTKPSRYEVHERMQMEIIRQLLEINKNLEAIIDKLEYLNSNIIDIERAIIRR